MASFMDAVKWMREGKKVRQASWENKQYYWHRGKIQEGFVETENFTDLSYIRDGNNNQIYLFTDWILATDWKIYKIYY